MDLKWKEGTFEIKEWDDALYSHLVNGDKDGIFNRLLNRLCKAVESSEARSHKEKTQGPLG